MADSSWFIVDNIYEFRSTSRCSVNYELSTMNHELSAMTAISTLVPSQTAYIAELVEKQRKYFAGNATKNVDFRIQQLKKLRELIIKNERVFLDALYKDLRKCDTEGYLTEIGFVLNDLDEAIAHTKKWAKPKSVPTPLFHAKASSHIQSEPYGNVLIIAPWNYPFQLLLAPMVGAMSAGNTVIAKPSEYAPHTAKAIADMIANNFSEEYIAIVEGAVPETQALLNEKFDYVFFTGSTEVGRIVYQAAAKHLTPVTLELGGKSPCIVDERIHIPYSAKRIMSGKLMNCGQTCIAPDYLLIHEKVKDDMVAEMKKQIEAFYTKNPQESEDYGRIINKKHFNRLKRLMDSGQVIYGGQTDEDDLYIAPTLLDDVAKDDPVMQEEIFGPILPILTYSRLEDAIQFINERSKPLALYMFSKTQKNIDKVMTETSAGGVSINDTLMHIANPNLPFGGVGDSGIGAYHGAASFDTFSHKKSILHKSFILDAPVRYAPYAKNEKLLRNMLRYLNK